MKGHTMRGKHENKSHSNTDQFNDLIEKSINKFKSPDTQICVENIHEGTLCIESRYARAVNAVPIMKLAIKAKEEGYDGIFVTCMDDPGVESIREKVDIPVIGAFQASVFTAIMLSEMFSIITVVDNVVPLIREHVREQGINGSLASIRVIDVSVPDLASKYKRENLIVELCNMSKTAIEEDGAEAIVLGCTGMVGIAAEVSGYLSEHYGKSIPVIDPNGVAIGFLELLIRNKLIHSKITYPVPPKEEDLAKKYAAIT
jgi:allantoin racemase